MMTYQNDYCSRRRRIYSNLKNNTLYRFHSYSHHIAVSLPLFFCWIYPDILHVHVIFLELVMGPMCSIVYENEPAETACKNHQDQ
jgi:Ca2+-transporting ATPase